MEPKSILSLPILAIGMILTTIFSQQNIFAQQAAAQRDGQHDFDFNFGKWKSAIQILTHPLRDSTAWVKMEGTVTVSKIWDGQASFEELEANGTGGHFEGANIYLYNPQS